MHRASLWAIILLSGLVVQTAAQQAVLMNRATLRVDPSSKNPPMLRLDTGTDVDLVDPSPSHSYYHVRMADGQEGWIYSQTLKLVSAIPPPTTPPTPTSPGTPLPAPAGVSTLFSPDWEKPAPNQTTFTGPDGECGPTGDGGDTSTNARKNRTDVPASYHEVTWKTLQSLTYPLHAARPLEQWPPHQIKVIQPFEGAPVSTVGYIATIKVGDTGSGESTKCHFASPKEVDWHVPLWSTREMRKPALLWWRPLPVRQDHPKWTATNLSAWVNSNSPVRISGWTLLDPEHGAQVGQFRSTL